MMTVRCVLFSWPVQLLCSQGSKLLDSEFGLLVSGMSWVKECWRRSLSTIGGWRGKGDHRKFPAAEVRVIVETIESQEQ